MKQNNKVALITGASSGIGKQTAIEMAKENYNLIITYNTNKDEIQKLETHLKNTYKIDILTQKLDLTNETEIKNLVTNSLKKFPQIDILINNASIAIDTTFEDKTKQNFQKILDTNLIGPFLLSREIGNHMYKNKHGKIINISSTNALDTYYEESLDYDASKAGIISLTHNLALKYKPYVTVNAIAPGWVNTPMNKNLDKEFINKENKKILLNRFANPEEIAKVIVFLASDDASYINNTVIRVDGGQIHD